MPSCSDPQSIANFYGKRKIKKFNFYEEEDNKLRNNINQERIIKGASNLSKSAKKDQEK